MNTQTTGIIGCAIAPYVWGLQSKLKTLCTLSSKFGVPPLLGSGAVTFKEKSEYINIRQLYVLSNSVPCLFSKATVGEIFAALGSSTTLLLHANVL